MKLQYVSLCGFRGYNKPLRIDFAEGFTIIDGRNGAGKSTIFDAIEFALTGSIGKYKDAKADGETVADYLWWNGDGPAPKDRYVEVGFNDGTRTFAIQRTQLGAVDPRALEAVQSRLCDPKHSPESPLQQLCATSIIRDELIAELSLDLKETDRYLLLHNAIGTSDAKTWVDRAGRIISAVKKRIDVAQKELLAATGQVSSAGHRLDGIRAAAISETVLAESVRRLQAFANTTVAPEILSEPARTQIADVTRQLEQLSHIESSWPRAVQERAKLVELERAVTTLEKFKADAEGILATFVPANDHIASGILAGEARDLIALVDLGRRVGLRDGHCPLCAAEHTFGSFNTALDAATQSAHELDAGASAQLDIEQKRAEAQARVDAAIREIEAHRAARIASEGFLVKFDQLQLSAGLNKATITFEGLAHRQRELHFELEQARADLRVLNTLNLSAGVEEAVRGELTARKNYASAEQQLGRCRRAEAIASALHDAARRAAGETLDNRLDRVLPLMSELYRRLRPHPIWDDIEYSVRGDVRRFLKLQVGDDLNPQFMFSSGQRRATGLAFLLSINLSLTWSRWKSVLLDDPVQHVDDFRTLHLAEVLAQLSDTHKQIICAVEDVALADLLCRRLPVKRLGWGKRVSLGPDTDGALSKLREQVVSPLQRQARLWELEQRVG
jgi:chromosome segregation protein